MTKKTATKISWTFLTMLKKQRKRNQTTAPRRTVTLQPPPASALCCSSGVAATKQVFFLSSQMTAKRKAPDRGDSANCAWRTSSPWSSSSSTSCSQRWQPSWPTRPSQKFWRSWKTRLCLLLTRRWTPFHAQVCMDNITWLVCGRSVWPFRHSSERRSEEFCWLQQDPLLSFFTCAGIALYPGNAQLLGCSHYYHNDIPPLVDPGKPQDIDCVVTEVTYVGPFSSKEEVSLF